MKQSVVWKAIQALAVLGIILAVYLLWEQLFRPPWQPCNINSFINCDAVIKGPVSKTLGIPTPLYGLIGYIVILIGATIKAKKLTLGVAIFGLLFCLRIAYIELFQLHVVCPVCITCQVDMIAVTLLCLYLFKKEPAKAN